SAHASDESNFSFRKTPKDSLRLTLTNPVKTVKPFSDKPPCRPLPLPVLVIPPFSLACPYLTSTMLKHKWRRFFESWKLDQLAVSEHRQFCAYPGEIIEIDFGCNESWAVGKFG